MPPRIVMGLEVELGLLGLSDDPGEREQFCLELVRAVADQAPHAWGIAKHTRFAFLANGGAFGPDPPRSVVPEYDTPECLSPLALAASLTAGMRLVARAAERVAAARRERDPKVARLRRLRGDLRLVAASMFYQGDDTGLGHHENYGVRWPSQRTPDALHDALLPWIVTRQLLTEPGFLTCADGTRGFGLSPRALSIERISGESTTHTRAIFTSRRSPYARKGWLRLHLIAAGATLSPWAVALRHGGTALLLTMALRGWTPPAACRIRDAIRALREVTLHPELPIETAAGVRTPHAISSQLCAEAEAEHARRSLAPWASRILAEWRLGLAVADAQIEAAEIWLEHALRRRILSAYLAEAGIAWPEMRFWFHFLRLAGRFLHPAGPLPSLPDAERLRAAIPERCLDGLDQRLAAAGKHWHDFPRFRRLVERLWCLDIELNRIAGGIADRQSGLRRQLGVEVITEAAIAAAEHEPPDPTRARTRAELIRRHAGDPGLRATWNQVHTSDARYDLPTPLARRARTPARPHPQASRPRRSPLDLGPLFATLRARCASDPVRIYERSAGEADELPARSGRGERELPEVGP